MPSNNRSRRSKPNHAESNTNQTVNGSERDERGDRNSQQQGQPAVGAFPRDLPPDDQYTIQPHAMYHPDDAHNYTESLQTVQKRSQEIHNKQRHQLGDLDYYVKNHPQCFSAHAYAHLKPLDIPRHVSNMGKSAPPGPFGPSQPGRLENQLTRKAPRPSQPKPRAPELIRGPRVVEPLRNDHRRTPSDQVSSNHRSRAPTLPAVSPTGNVGGLLSNGQQPPTRFSPPRQQQTSVVPLPLSVPEGGFSAVPNPAAPIEHIQAPAFNGQQPPTRFSPPRQQHTSVVPLPLSVPEGGFLAVPNPAALHHIHPPNFGHQQPDLQF
ncbi:MAG: hypothetical protein Q9183_003507, partial [Haloplaca sp. 2 TL-2023]